MKKFLFLTIAMIMAISVNVMAQTDENSVLVQTAENDHYEYITIYSGVDVEEWVLRDIRNNVAIATPIYWGYRNEGDFFVENGHYRYEYVMCVGSHGDAFAVICNLIYSNRYGYDPRSFYVQ